MRCPFDDPAFMVPPMGVPCPLCGCKGGDPDEVERLCVDGLVPKDKLIDWIENDKATPSKA